jgi:hypothetical protein
MAGMSVELLPNFLDTRRNRARPGLTGRTVVPASRLVEKFAGLSQTRRPAGFGTQWKEGRPQGRQEDARGDGSGKSPAVVPGATVPSLQ